MVLGSYYLTIEKRGAKGEGKVFSSENEAMMAYQEEAIDLHAPIKVRRSAVINGEKVTKLVDVTMGRIIFNEPIPQDLGFVDRRDPGKVLDLEICFVTTKKELGQIIDRCIKKHGSAVTAELLDKIKAQGFKYSTRGAITISVSDMEVPPQKQQLIAEAEKNIDVITKQYRRGLISDEERYNLVIDTWDKTTREVTNALTTNLDRFNPIFMMANSGARGSINQIRQLAGMRASWPTPRGAPSKSPLRPISARA
jgi:DNA-directed RNA polymerase subunit beta'